MEKQIAQIFSELLGKNININDDIQMDNELNWDSLKHIELIMTIEEELDISFNPKDIPELTSMQKIIDKIKELK